MAAAGALTSLLTGWGTPGLLALAVGASSLASQLSVTPFFCRLRPHRGQAPVFERAAQWVLILTVTPIVFWLDDFPAMVFMVIPLLAWGALRSGAYESIAQLFVILGIAITLTTRGHGPFAVVDARYDLPVDVQGILLSVFIIDCALIVVPFVLSVGEQLENARQVAAERDRVQNIVNGMTGVAIIVTDEVGRITLFNPGAERLLGYSADEVLGQLTRMLPLRCGDHGEGGRARRRRRLHRGRARALMGTGPSDMMFVRKDGVERSHSMSLNRIVDDRGQTLGYVSTSEDITERVEAESRLVEALETERRAVERLRDVDQVKDAFVSSVSHELRTPITSILGYTEMLEEGAYGGLGHDQLDAVRRVATNSTRLLSLIDDLLTLSRIQEDGIGLRRPGGRPAQDRRRRVRGRRPDPGAPLARAEGRPARGADPVPRRPRHARAGRDQPGGQRREVHPGGRSRLGRPHPGRARRSCWRSADTGIGIPLQEQEMLFTRFFRSSLAQEQAIPGSGLGLSIAHAIVEQHGGSIAVESQPGEGTTFRVLLPVLAPV